MVLNQDRSPANFDRYDKISLEEKRSLVKEEGYSIIDASNLLSINYSSARTILANFGKTGQILQKLKGNLKKTVLTNDVKQQVERIVSENPSLTLKLIKSAFETYFGSGFTISTSSIDRCLAELKITMKLIHRELDRINSPDIIEARSVYSLWFNDFFAGDYSRVVFVDESSFTLHTQRSYARSIQGARAFIRVPTVRGRSISLLASISYNRMGYCKTITNSTVNSNIFNIYLEELCEHLRDVMHMTDVCLIFDNARIHRPVDVQRIAGTFGFTVRFLSPCSYMLNPIENSFSKIKLGVRSRLAYNETGYLSDLILSEVSNVSSSDCQGYFRYVQTNITNCAASRPYVHQ